MAAEAITPRLIESLYSDALLLADETRGYFDQAGTAERAALSAAQRVLLACEALKASTRLMQIIAWLLLRKAVAAGELAAGEADDPRRRLEDGPSVDPAALADFPAQARALILAGVELHQRVARLDAGAEPERPVASPARALLQRLQRSI
ncbi:DUF1465 family protein [Sphingomonas bacterium]|uniref:DUF1465 family protein n=1 Tax=Sphingomonas bacterium TaxID=1895847 RepID=UPI0020C7464C|nr:DUF1465 family protein [Sphingomonas bacterium]